MLRICDDTEERCTRPFTDAEEYEEFDTGFCGFAGGQPGDQGYQFLQKYLTVTSWGAFLLERGQRDDVYMVEQS